jgi:hypothetical protein
VPYIKEMYRVLIDPTRYVYPAQDTGELNFQITCLVKRFLGNKPNYAKFNEAVGVLECAKLELYRRMVAPYEDTKITENGDVY